MFLNWNTEHICGDLVFLLPLFHFLFFPLFLLLFYPHITFCFLFPRRVLGKVCPQRCTTSFPVNALKVQTVLCVREEGESRLFICVPDFGMTNTDRCAAQRQTQVTALKKKKNKERWRLIGVINIIQERWALNWRWPEISNEMPAPKAAAHLT